MTAFTANDLLFHPDDPLRRAVWVLPLALLLVVLALLGFGVMLRTPMKKAPPPPPIRAEIYELPGKVGPKPRAKSEAMRRKAPKVSKPAPPRPAETIPAPKPAPKPVPPAVVHTAPPPKPKTRAAPKPPVLAKPAARHGEIVRHAPSKPKPKTPVAKTRPKPTPPVQSAPPKQLNWAQLRAQVNDAVAATVDRPAVDRIRDPDSLVAHYYLASVLNKLERVGQLTYQASMVGQAAVAIVIGSQGELVDLQLAGSSGQPRIDGYAQQIVRMSAPFAPFPADLERRTPRIRIVVHMDFQGYREVQAN